jgi:hypothetical protein
MQRNITTHGVPRVTLREMRAHVTNKMPFINTNKTCYAEHNLFTPSAQSTETDVQYVVYSYGDHWPLFIFRPATNTWYENTSKYGVTTSRHHSSCKPFNTRMHGLPVAQMVKLAQGAPISEVVVADALEQTLAGLNADTDLDVPPHFA